MKKPYKVTIVVTSTHEYTVPECNSPQEAEDIAEAYFADGEEGDVQAQDIDSIEAIEDEGGE